MTAKKKSAADEIVDQFKIRPGTNYHRMMCCLAKNFDEPVKLDELARYAYQGKDLDKARNRIVTMTRLVQERHIVKNKLPFKIEKEKIENAITYKLLAK